MPTRVRAGRLSIAADLATIAVCVTAIAIYFGQARKQDVGEAERRTARMYSADTISLVQEEGWVRGPAGALVTLVEFGDYECSACRRHESYIRGFMSKWPRDLRVVWRHYPLSYHDGAVPAARAVDCAAALGRFPEFHEALFRNGKWRWNPEVAFVEIARDIGIPSDSGFEGCLGDLSETPRILRDRRLAEALELPQTPYYVLDGVALGAGVDSAQLDLLISRAMSRAAQ